MTAAPGAAGRSRHLRVSRAMRVVAYFVAALVVLYLAFLAVLRTAWFNGLLLNQARAAIERVTGARVEIGSLAISPWAFQATLHGIVLHGSETPPEPPLFAARQLVIQISPGAALHWRLQLRRVDLEGAQVHLYSRPDGATNLPGPAAGGAGPAAIDDLLNLRIRQLLVGQSSVSWDNRQWPLRLSAHNVSVVLGFRNAKYTGSVSATDVSLERPGIALPATTFATRIELARNRLGLDSLVWRSPALKGSGSAVIHWQPALESAFSFQIEGDARQAAAMLRQAAVRGGRFSIRGEGSYRGGIVSARGHVDARGLGVETAQFRPPAADFSADYSLNGARLQLTRLEASLLGGVARGNAAATLGPRAPTFKAALDLQHFDLGAGMRSITAAPAVFSEFPLAGLASGKLEISGGARSTRAAFNITLQAALPAPGRDPVSGYVRGSAILSPALSVTVDDARLQTAASAVTIRGQLAQQARLALQVRTTSFDEWRAPSELLAEAPLPLILHAPATFAGTLTGTPAEPAVSGVLRLGDFVFRGWKWTALTATIAASPSELDVTSASLRGYSSVLRLELRAGLEQWKFTPASQLTLSARARDTAIEGLRKVLDVNYPLDGRLTGQLSVTGTRERLAGQGALQVTSGSYAGEPFKTFTAEISVRNGAWRVSRFELVKGHGKVSGEARFDPSSQTFSARAGGGGFQLADFARLRSAGVPAGPGGSIAGTLSFSAQAEGSMANPSGQATVELGQFTASGVNLGALGAQLSLHDHQATVDGQLQGAGEAIQLHGTARTEGDWPLQATVQYSGLRLDPWLRAAGLSQVAASIETSGSLQASIALRKRGTLEVNTGVQSLQIGLADLKWQNARPFELRLTDRRATLTAFELVGPSTEIKIQGSAGLGPPTNLNLTADGQIDSSILHAMDPALLTAGLFRIQLKATGPLRDPSLHGALHVEKLSLGYPGIPLRLADLSGDIELQGDRVVIRSLQSRGGPATVTFTGGAILSGTRRFNLRAEFQHVRADFPVEFTSVLSGSIRLSGSAEAAALTGNVTVEQMFLPEDFNLLNWLAELANQAPPGLPAGPAPVSSRVRLDVHIGSSPNVNVESHDLTASASVDLSLRGTLADPVAYGTAHILSGKAVVRQTTYTIARGDVIMANPLRTAPTLDIEAKTRIQSHDLVLRITGPADRPSISYRSDPPLPTPEILALLAFGYTNENQLVAANTRSSLGTMSAGALLSQALSSRTSSRITRLFGLSRISINPNPSSLGGARVTVAEQLARDFTVTYVTTTGGVYERIIQVEWNVSENISVLGIRDQNGVFGLEVDFRHRFK